MAKVEKVSTGYKPRPLQAKLHNELKRFNVLVIHRRFGKCFVGDTPVLTSTGFKNIKDIKEGDYVYTPKGTLTKVTGTYYGGRKKLYNIEFDCGEKFLTDDNHLWYVEKSFSKCSPRIPWKCGEIKSTKEILQNKDFKFIPKTAPLKGKGELPIDPWEFGYWLGNGDSDQFQLCVSSDDIHLMDGRDFSNRSDKGSGCSYFYFSKRSKKLRSLNVINNKHIPLKYIKSSYEDRVKLLHGLMDSDGTVLSSGSCRFDSSSKKLIEDFQVLISSLGIKGRINFYDREGKKEYRIIFTAKDFLPFSLERKNEKVRINKRPIRHKIKNIEKTKKIDDVYCISVADEDKLFLVGKNLIPTHNTVFSINEMIDKALRNELHNPQYAYVAPTYKQAKIIAWEYMQDYTRNIVGFEANKSELTVYIHRQGVKDSRGEWVKKPDKIKFMLLGADNPDALRGIYLDGAVLDEYAQCDPIVWGEIIRPALSDRTGWAVFIGTPKGQNHFYDRFERAKKNPNWYAKIWKASDTGIIPPHEIEDMKLDMNDEEFQQEMECSFTASVLGSYYGKIIERLEDNGHIGDYPYDPAYPVDTFWDLGIGDCLTVWFRQKLPGSFHYIDYYEQSGVSLPEVVRMLKEKEYVYGKHVIPWDGKARELGTGLTRQETLAKLGIRADVQKRQGVEDRIQATRVLLPKCRFNSALTARGLDCLRNYQKEWDTKLMMFKTKPKHDWACHGADSFGYSALDLRAGRMPDDEFELPREAVMEYNALGGY